MNSMTHTPNPQQTTTQREAPGVVATHQHTRLQGAAAALAILVAAVHIVDQGGIIGSKSPSYVGIGYWILELIALAVAGRCIVGHAGRLTWALALGVGAGPLIGFALSRGPGLPGYTDDRGNWSEPLGIISLVVEGLLVLVAALGAAIAPAKPTA